jgi:acyl-CoA synthetase (AMP-forming)/AMP-acid ligase II
VLARSLIARSSRIVTVTFVELLRRNAAEQGGDVAFSFLGDDEPSITWGELDGGARAIAALLLEEVEPGARVALLYPPGLDYPAALFGCFYAGAVAVPAYPPDVLAPDRGLSRLRAILRDADVAAVLTSEALAEPLRAVLGGARVLATDTLAGEGPAPAAAAPDDLALLQYTSGSTAEPRGVMLSHANLTANSQAIHVAFGTSPSTRSVIWLPPYHDMGLIGGILQPVYVGFPVTLMSPLTFVRRPLRWLRALSDLRATVTGGPNFAYDLCVRRTTPEERAQLDLTSWDVAFNGAEPVRMATIERFAAAFAPAGFRTAAFLPCYGLAESTLIVTAVDRAAPPHAVERDGAGPSVVSCGRPVPGHDVRIAGDGEICVTGPSVARGYWPPDRDDAGVFDGTSLRTGDLGFLRDGELFVTGRIKELIVLAGRNHHPADIELACEQRVPGLRPGCGAAFGFDRSGSEQLAVVYEVAEDVDPAATVLAIRGAVAHATAATACAVVLLGRGTIPKTSSGKVRRIACRTRFLDDQLDALHVWPADGSLSQPPPASR